MLKRQFMYLRKENTLNKMEKEENQEVTEFKKEAFGRARLQDEVKEVQINQDASAMGKERGRCESIKFMLTHFSSS